ncbi:MAG: hypothetical protein KGK07_07580 [Chloroflexota bacterium]|nr:hypothetical protein [Chloroflexota bacterium]
MWSEPLTAASADDGRSVVTVTVLDGQGAPVAHVRCDYNRAAHTGLFGEMVITATGGSPQQRVRALVLLVRQALAAADALGLTRVRTEAAARLLPFAERMSNLRGRELHAGGRFDLAGDLHSVRTHVLDTTGADGSDTAISPSPKLGEGAGG